MCWTRAIGELSLRAAQAPVPPQSCSTFSGTNSGKTKHSFLVGRICGSRLLSSLVIFPLYFLFSFLSSADHGVVSYMSPHIVRWPKFQVSGMQNGQNRYGPHRGVLDTQIKVNFVLVVFHRHSGTNCPTLPNLFEYCQLLSFKNRQPESKNCEIGLKLIRWKVLLGSFYLPSIFWAFKVCSDHVFKLFSETFRARNFF